MLSREEIAAMIFASSYRTPKDRIGTWYVTPRQAFRAADHFLKECERQRAQQDPKECDHKWVDSLISDKVLMCDVCEAYKAKPEALCDHPDGGNATTYCDVCKMIVPCVVEPAPKPEPKECEHQWDNARMANPVRCMKCNVMRDRPKREARKPRECDPCPNVGIKLCSHTTAEHMPAPSRNPKECHHFWRESSLEKGKLFCGFCGDFKEEKSDAPKRKPMEWWAFSDGKGRIIAFDNYKDAAVQCADDQALFRVQEVIEP